MQFTLTIEEKSFTNDKNESVDYLDCVATIAGQKIKFYPKPEDKSLLKYLVGSLSKTNVGNK